VCKRVDFESTRPHGMLKAHDIRRRMQAACGLVVKIGMVGYTLEHRDLVILTFGDCEVARDLVAREKLTENRKRVFEK
jgi:hypothetical protein